ncbi:MAG TPA: putative sulfate/molybdate transporter [Desulfobacterales bacterium]|nr:putative sulfate/molybdate transporter [Desulfobacterales bacterium]
MIRLNKNPLTGGTSTERKEAMRTGAFKFNRVEFAGSLGDLGTLIPLTVALVVISGLSVTTVLVMVGSFYIFSGLYFKLPIPVQPLKVVCAIAIAFPEKISLPIISASAILFGCILLVLALTGLIDWIAKFFTRPIMRGIQLGLGFILINKGLDFVLQPEIFIEQSGISVSSLSPIINPALGIFGFLIALLLLSSKRFPSSLVILSIGIVAGIFCGALQNIEFSMGPTPLKIFRPAMDDFVNGFFLLVLPQIPLTLGNAVMGTADTCYSLFGKGNLTERATYRSFACTMGLANIIAGVIGGMPMCHGAGGLAAHYRFGARTGGANLMIGAIFLFIGIVFGKTGIALLSSIPNAILGVLLLFAGLELALLIKDVENHTDLFLTFLIAGIGFVTTNMGIAFFVGIIILHFIRWKKIKI